MGNYLAASTGLRSFLGSEADSSDGQSRGREKLRRIRDLCDALPDPEEFGRAPGKAGLAELLAAVDCLTLGDVGLTGGWVGTQSRPLYLPVLNGDSYDLALFLLPKGCQLPTHDHPGMSVLSKVLHGALEVRSYDWTELVADGAHEAKMGFAKTGGPLVKTPEDEAWFLSAESGNVHSFGAVEQCVVFDLLVPPYDVDGDRDCHYYRVEALDAGGADEGSASGTVILREVPEPGGLPSYYPYRGPTP